MKTRWAEDIFRRNTLAVAIIVYWQKNLFLDRVNMESIQLTIEGDTKREDGSIETIKQNLSRKKAVPSNNLFGRSYIPIQKYDKKIHP